jgi:hypothetical protein
MHAKIKAHRDYQKVIFLGAPSALFSDSGVDTKFSRLSWINVAMVVSFQFTHWFGKSFSCGDVQEQYSSDWDWSDKQ